MKRMDFLKELRSLNVAELKTRADDFKTQSLNMRVKLKEGLLKNPMSLRMLRRNIAIVNTILRQTQDKEKEKQSDRR